MRIQTFQSRQSRIGGTNTRASAPDDSELTKIQAQGLRDQADRTRQNARTISDNASVARRSQENNLDSTRAAARGDARAAATNAADGRALREFGERKLREQQQFQRFKTQTEFQTLSSELDAEFDNQVQNAEPGAPGLHDNFMDGAFRKKVDKFLENVPGHLRDEYALRLEVLQEATSNRVAGAERTQRNAFYKDSIQAQVAGLGAQLSGNPAAALNYEADIYEQIDATSLTALEKLKLKRNASVELRQSAIKGLVEAGRFTEARVLSVAEPKFAIVPDSPALYRTAGPQTADTIAQSAGATDPAHNEAVKAFATAAGGKDPDAPAAAYIVGALKSIFGAWGSPGNGNPKARTFLNFGKPVNSKKPKLGDVVIIDKDDRQTPNAHVGIYAGQGPDGGLLLVGGSPNGGIKRTSAKADRVLAVRRPPDAEEEAKTTLFGGGTNPTGAVLSEYTERLIKAKQKGLKRQSAAVKRQVKELIKDDLASIEATGEGVEELTQESVARVLGNEAAIEWLNSRENAAEFQETTADFTEIPLDEIRTRVNDLAPASGVGFRDAQKYHDQATRLADEIEKQRLRDPAAAADQTEAVKSALATIDPTDPSTFETLTDMRLAAQEQLGIDEALRTPITKTEAKALTREVITAPEIVRLDAVNEMVRTVDAAFGPHADDVLRFAIAESVRDDDTANLIIATFRNLQEDKAIGVANAQIFEQEADTRQAETFSQDTEEREQFTRIMDGRDPNPIPDRAPGISAHLRQPKRREKSQKRAAPIQAINALINEPALMEQFIAKYGPDAVPERLRPKS